ncbi:unnamed protein product [Blepharisma stoltei]|uniref:Uncharacterized protein n=1 Tax=Blepharisma stoltei TaxID=1481888 RepID=A0AAU9K538_9CILI|nr:unnamed protein product [Blepharisma stoltei]
MSVYSGFSTRLQETQYYKLTENLIYLLQAKILSLAKLISHEDEDWVKQFNITYNQMAKLELHKYLEPKFSDSCKNLAMHYSSYYLEDEYNKQPSVKSISRERSLVNQMSRTERFISQTPQRRTKPKIQTKKFHRHSYQNSETLNQTPSQSRYYSKIMNSFLKGTPKNAVSKNPSRWSKKKKREETLNLDLQDFWLIDDKIQLID